MCGRCSYPSRRSKASGVAWLCQMLPPLPEPPPHPVRLVLWVPDSQVGRPGLGGAALL